MTVNRDDAEFADIDTYITGQLSKAAAALTEHSQTRATLDAVLRAANRETNPSGAADASTGG